MTDTSPVTVVNRALMESLTRTTISTMEDPSSEGDVVRALYTPCRQQILRAATWGFARRTAQLNLLGSAFTNPPTSEPPWLFMYAYPPDCLKVRYLFLPWGWPGTQVAPGVPATGFPVTPNQHGPRRTHRFLPSTFVDNNGNDSKVILTNAGGQGQGAIPPQLAWAAYTRDVTNVALWDALAIEALVMLLAAKFVAPLGGNVKMKGDFVKLGQMAIMEARAADANEALPTSDHTPDWIRARGTGSRWGRDGSGLGVWAGEDAAFWEGNDEINWGA